MAILSGMCIQAKRDFLMGVHRPEDKYKLALYSASAHLNPLTTTYTTEGEISGKGYERGGQLLAGYVCEIDGASAVLGWQTPVWQNATISAHGALIYNASKGNRALVVVEFGEEVKSTNGRYRLPMPPLTAASALVRLL